MDEHNSTAGLLFLLTGVSFSACSLCMCLSKLRSIKAELDKSPVLPWPDDPDYFNRQADEYNRRAAEAQRLAANVATNTTTSAASNLMADDTVAMVQNMTPADRKEYLANFLKTETFQEGKYAISRSVVVSDNDDVRNAVQPSCAICLDTFTTGEDVCVSQHRDCPHQFHLHCATEWLLQSQECPCCRRDYLTIP